MYTMELSKVMLHRCGNACSREVFSLTDQENMLDTEVSINTDESYIMDQEELLQDDICTNNEDEDTVDDEQKPPLR